MQIVSKPITEWKNNDEEYLVGEKRPSKLNVMPLLKLLSDGTGSIIDTDEDLFSICLDKGTIFTQFFNSG